MALIPPAKRLKLRIDEENLIVKEKEEL